MASKLLTKGSELYGKKKEVEGQGLKAEWAGAKIGPDKIAACSKGRQYDGADGGSKHRRAAPLRKDRGYGSFSKDMTGGVSEGRMGYGKV